MTVVKTIGLMVGMGLVGVQIIGIVAMPLGFFVIKRLAPMRTWQMHMIVYAQLVGAVATALVGAFVLHLPWYACLIAAVVVGITSYARPADPGLLEDAVFDEEYGAG